ncbi:MAG: hypothetical protein V4668_02530 [Patescibacteria group bacterium]
MNKKLSSFLGRAIFGLALILQFGCERAELNRYDVSQAEHQHNIQDDSELEPELAEIESVKCVRASRAQIATVDLGNTKLNQFLSRCSAETQNSSWCQQVARPNPESHGTFDCTYSVQQPHFFIHPDEKSWDYAITAVKLIKELQTMGVKIATIYNWWRPEPYNSNVGGAAGRHPFGTSIDVRFASKADQEKAHKQLCKWRAQGRLRALGYYSGTALHLGIGDKAANTWGKACL